MTLGGKAHDFSGRNAVAATAASDDVAAAYAPCKPSADGTERKKVMRLSAGKLPLALVALTAIVAAASAAGCGGTSSAAKKSAASSTAQSVPGANIKLIIRTDEEHAKKGPDGKFHDAFLPAAFTVQPGQRVTVTVINYDSAKHSFNAAGLGVNEVLAGASGKTPGSTTFSFTAPAKAGEYEWSCNLPCDPWAMMHKGYMRGAVTVA